ncbi:MAG: helix-turn-helix domain-containing protein, partial [Nitrosotalea sp.]
MSSITDSKPKVLNKSRNRIYGKKRSHDAILKEIVKLVLQGTEPSKIAEITGKNRSTIWRYLNEATKQGLIQKTSTGRIKLPQTIKDSKVYEILGN